MKRIIKSKLFFTVFNQISLFLGSFLVFALLSKKLSVSELGEWAIFMTVISLSDSIRQGLFHQGTIRISSKSKSVLKASILLNFIFILAMSGLINLVMEMSDLIGFGSEYSLLRYTFLGFLMVAPAQIWNTLSICTSKLKRQLIINFVYSASQVLIILSLFNLGQASLNEIIVYQSFAAIPMLSLILMELLKGKWDWKSIIKDSKEIIGFGKFNSISSLISLFFQKSDILVLSLFTGNAAIGIYHFATKIINYSDLFLNALSQYYFPRISEEFFKKSDALSKIYQSGIFMMLLALIPAGIAFIFFLDDIVLIIGNESLLASKDVIYILFIASISKPMGRMFGIFLDAINRPDINMKMLFMSLIFNLIMNFILVPSMGINGAAIATSLSIIITIIFGHTVNLQYIKDYKLYKKQKQYLIKN